MIPLCDEKVLCSDRVPGRILPANGNRDAQEGEFLVIVMLLLFMLPGANPPEVFDVVLVILVLFFLDFRITMDNGATCETLDTGDWKA